MSKRIVFLANYNDGDYKGGIANILECYCDNSAFFENNGYVVDWINLGIKYSNNKCIKTFQKIKNLFFEKIMIYGRIKKKPLDLVHIHSSRGYTLYKDLLIAKYLKKKTALAIVLSIHFADIEKIFSDNKRIRKLEIEILKTCVDRVVCLSEKTANELSAYIDKKNISILYTFHNFTINDKQVALNENSILQLMFMGSIDKRKGVFDLIEAVNRLNFKIHLRIYGGFGNDAVINNQFFQLIENNSSIEYCDYVSGSKKEDAFEKTDIFILPSYGEGMPIVIMEAFAKGCAIISTNVGAIPEIVKSENGILINPGDVDCICSAISKMNSDRFYLQKMKENNLLKSKQFSLNSNIKALCDIYGATLND